MDENFKESIIEEYIVKEGNKRDAIVDLKRLALHIPPLLAGTVISTITSNPSYIGIASILIVLEEIGTDIKTLYNMKNADDFKLPNRDLKKYPNILYFNPDRKRVISFIEYCQTFYSHFYTTTSIYDIEVDLDKEEIDIILREIDKIIVLKKFEEEREDIFSNYYKKMLAVIINNDETVIDVNHFLDSLKYLEYMNLVTKKERAILTKRIINKLEIYHSKKEELAKEKNGGFTKGVHAKNLNYNK